MTRPDWYSGRQTRAAKAQSVLESAQAAGTTWMAGHFASAFSCTASILAACSEVLHRSCNSSQQQHNEALVFASRTGGGPASLQSDTQSCSSSSGSACRTAASGSAAASGGGGAGSAGGCSRPGECASTAPVAPEGYGCSAPAAPPQVPAAIMAILATAIAAVAAAAAAAAVRPPSLATCHLLACSRRSRYAWM